MNRISRGFRAVAGHFPPIALFVLLTILFTMPLAGHMTDGVVGSGAADNMSALWNVWWARTAIRGPDSLLWTPALFAPLGTSLALHSLAPLESALAALLPFDQPVVLYNSALLGSVFLNFFCAYLAAWVVTRDRLASLFAGITFGGAPFLVVRLEGHLNVLSAWGLPLLLIAAVRFERRPGWPPACAIAGALGVLAYTDYYFAIFGAVMLAAHLLLARRSLELRGRRSTNASRRALVAIVALIAMLVIVIVWIEITGGVDTSLGGIRLRMTESFNPRVALGFLMLAALLVWKRPAIVVADEDPVTASRQWRLVAVIVVLTLVLVAPLGIAGIRLWRAGDYESQTYFWRSAPPGIDIATFVLGNPLSAISGGWTTAALARLGIDRIESTAWLGVVPMVLIAVAMIRLRSRADVRRYLWIGALFLVWSLGPYLRILGRNTAFMLPQTFLHFVPVVANARIPGRAFVVVQLMTAMIGALALASLPRATRTIFAAAAVTLVVVDYWPAPRQWTFVDRPAIYEMLKQYPGGIVLEVPIGIRDGFGHRGSLDHRVLLYQTIHAHPQMGGFVARLSSRIKSAYESDPVIGPLLDLSEGKPGPSRSAPPDQCVLTCDVRYVVVDEAAASAELQALVARTFSLQPIGRSGRRALYSVRIR